MPDGSDKVFSFIAVRGNTSYGINNFVDNGDKTITDKATGLMWSKDDSQSGMNWQQALAYAQIKNADNYCGHNDWRLPDTKELQSIVGYTRSPGSTNSAAINQIFNCTSITNEAGNLDWPWFWTSTTHKSYDGTTYRGSNGIYVCFGRAAGWMMIPGTSYYSYVDVHGAGAQRSSPKSGTYLGDKIGVDINGKDVFGLGPQGDVLRVNNFVRLVRDVTNSTGVLPKVPVIQTSGSTTICDGDSLLLYITPQLNVSYQWKNGTTNVGTNLPTYTVTKAGIYSVVVTNSKGSVTSSNSILVSVNSKPGVIAIMANSPTTFCDGDSVVLISPTQQIVSYQWKKDNNNTGSNNNSLTVFSSGVYTLEIFNDCGKTLANNSITVKVNPIPSTPSIIQISDDTLACSSNADSYSWYLDGNKTNFNTKFIKVLENGNYSVIVTKNGCNSKESVPFQLTTLGVEDVTNMTGFTIYPNPSSDFISLPGYSGEIKIYDIIGREIWNGNIDLNEKLDVSNFQAGLYMVKLSNINSIYVIKLIKN